MKRTPPLSKGSLCPYLSPGTLLHSLEPTDGASSPLWSLQRVVLLLHCRGAVPPAPVWWLSTQSQLPWIIPVKGAIHTSAGAAAALRSQRCAARTMAPHEVTEMPLANECELYNAGGH